MTTESLRDQDDETGVECSDPVEARDRSPVRPVELGERAPATGKAVPAARPGITPAEAELLGEYNLHNG